MSQPLPVYSAKYNLSTPFRVCSVLSMALISPFVLAAEAELISVSSHGTQGNGDTECYLDLGDIAISDNGEVVVFSSHADNLVDNDVNDSVDLFRRDRSSGQTEKMNPDVISGGSGQPCNPAVSADGTQIVFETFGRLLPEDTRFPSGDLYLVDTTTGYLELVSVDSLGRQLTGHSYFSDISADGNLIVFQTYANASTPRIVLRNRTARTTVDVCVNTNGTPANAECDNPSLSADGRFVAFDSLADNLDLIRPDTNQRPDVFLHELATGVTTRVSIDSLGNGQNGLFDNSIRPDLSADGRFIAFESLAAELVDSDTNDASDVFVHDRIAGTTSRVSVSSAGREGDHDSFHASISSDGRYISFLSAARTLSPTDTTDFGANDFSNDVYVHDLWTRQTIRVSEPFAPFPYSDDHSVRQAISADGSHIAYISNARNLIRNDANGVSDAFVIPNDPDRLLAAPVGDLNIDHEWADLCRIDRPPDSVMILGPPTYNGRQPGVGRLTMTGAGSCALQSRFQEWDYIARDLADYWHNTEQVSYLAMRPGVYPMPDGSIWKVGSFQLFGTEHWKRIDFGTRFAGRPALFLTIQSQNGGQAATVRARDVTNDGFEAALFEEEYLLNGHANERIAYLAVFSPDAAVIPGTESLTKGVLVLDNIELPYVLTRSQVDHRWHLIDGIKFTIQEEQSLDAEVAHKTEAIDVLKIGSTVFAQQVTSNGQDTTAIRRRDPE